MTEAEKIANVRVLADETDATEMPDTTIAVYLDKAERAIASRRYPFGIPYETEIVEGVEVTTQVDPTLGYEMLQCELAARYINRKGGEGETSHNESGVNRSYGSANDEDLLKEIIQVAKV